MSTGKNRHDSPNAGNLQRSSSGGRPEDRRSWRRTRDATSALSSSPTASPPLSNLANPMTATPNDGASYDPRAPVAHVAVVQFHHKNGPEVEFLFPPLRDAPPPGWDVFPFLALPDGAHQTLDEDYVHFILHNAAASASSSLERSHLFGISCYRQMRTEELTNKAADVTRSRVQKAVVVLMHKVRARAID